MVSLERRLEEVEGTVMDLVRLDGMVDLAHDERRGVIRWRGRPAISARSKRQAARQ